MTAIEHLKQLEIKDTVLKKYCENMICYAYEASKLMNNKFNIQEKGEVQNIVTTSDINIQHYLFNKLKELIPESGFFCEEENFIDINHEYVWIIDPIDGTENYSRKIPECCISICLAKNQERIIGVLYNPLKDECYYAIKGYGAYKNGEQIHVSNRPFNRSLFCTSLCLYRKEFGDVCLNVLGDIYPRIKDFRRFASAALEICYLAEGKIDMYFEMNLSIWDYSAAYLVLKEAGGIAYTFNRQDPDFRKVTLLYAANCENTLNELESTIKKHLKEDPFKK